MVVSEHRPEKVPTDLNAIEGWFYNSQLAGLELDRLNKMRFSSKARQLVRFQRHYLWTRQLPVGLNRTRILALEEYYQLPLSGEPARLKAHLRTLHPGKSFASAVRRNDIERMEKLLPKIRDIEVLVDALLPEEGPMESYDYVVLHYWPVCFEVGSRLLERIEELGFEQHKRDLGLETLVGVRDLQCIYAWSLKYGSRLLAEYLAELVDIGEWGPSEEWLE